MSDEAIPAATLIVARDRPDGPPQLLMVERAEGMAFAAGALVFPGGRIDEADGDLNLGPALVAAVRETLEETAVPVGLNPVPSREEALALQRALTADEPFAALLAGAGIRIDGDALTPFARWVPKFHAVRKFDTLFFVAQSPSGDWEPQVIEGDCAGASWITAVATSAYSSSAAGCSRPSNGGRPMAGGGRTFLSAEPRAPSSCQNWGWAARAAGGRVRQATASNPATR